MQYSEFDYRLGRKQPSAIKMNNGRRVNEFHRNSRSLSLHPGKYRGVRKRSWGKWASEIKVPMESTRIWLGSFENPEMAARAYDVAAFTLKGTSAVLNFPNLVHTLPRPCSKHPVHIKIAAAQAAAVFQSVTPGRTQTSPLTEIQSSCAHGERSEDYVHYEYAYSGDGDLEDLDSCQLLDRKAADTMEGLLASPIRMVQPAENYLDGENESGDANFADTMDGLLASPILMVQPAENYLHGENESGDANSADRVAAAFSPAHHLLQQAEWKKFFQINYNYLDDDDDDDDDDD